MRRLATTALTLLVLCAATACSATTESGASTDCSLDGCTVTFPRTGEPEVSVLGVRARLLGAEGGTARLDVAGHEVALQVGTRTEVSGLTVGVESITPDEVVAVVER